jgi:hypothetical protein
MIFYKLSTITKKLQQLFGRLKTLIKLASIRRKYIIHVLDVEQKIVRLEQIRQNTSINQIKSQGENSQKENNPVWEMQSYLKSLEPSLIEFLKRVELTVILSELFDDCLSVLTDKGLIQYSSDGWFVDFRNGKTARFKFMYVAVESLFTGKEVRY